MTKSVIRWIPLVALLATLVVPGRAQAQRGRGEPPDRAALEQRIRAQMGRMMQERLGLSDEQAARLSEVVQSFDGRRRDLAQREQDTRRRVAALTEANDDDAEARSLLELQAQLRMEEAQVFGAEQEALLQVLTPRQVLELQDLREDLGRRIRALRGPGGQGRGTNPNQQQRGRGRRPDGRIGEHAAPGSGIPL